LISGFNEKSAKKIEELRTKTGPWQDWDHFLKHVPLLRSELTTLAAADALLPLGVGRRAAIWMAAAAPHSAWLEDIEEPLPLADETAHERIQQDYRATGTSLFAHPAQLFRESLWCYAQNPAKLKLAKEIDELIPNQVIMVFGMILILQRPPSANGMMFITLEDETGYMNLVLTPETVKKFAHILHGQSMLCVSGKIQRQGLAHSLMIRDVYPPQMTQADVIPLQPLQKPPSSPAAAPTMGYPDLGEFTSPARSYF
jgi:error-prone DNA polymerase